MISWQLEVAHSDKDDVHVRTGTADSLRKAKRSIIRAIEAIEQEIAELDREDKDDSEV